MDSGGSALHSLGPQILAAALAALHGLGGIRGPAAPANGFVH